jgi:hypothetical protein
VCVCVRAFVRVCSSELWSGGYGVFLSFCTSVVRVDRLRIEMVTRSDDKVAVERFWKY